MAPPTDDSQAFLSILKACDPKWLAEALFYRQQTDPILNRLCQLKVGIEKGKQGDIEALGRGLEAAVDLESARHRSLLSEDYDLILTQSWEDLVSLRNLPNYEESIRPLLEQFVIRAASASMELEEGFGWWSALEDLCAQLNFPKPEPP